MLWKGLEGHKDEKLACPQHELLSLAVGRLRRFTLYGASKTPSHRKAPPNMLVLLLRRQRDL